MNIKSCIAPRKYIHVIMVFFFYMHIYFFHVLLTSTNFFNKKTLICKDWVANKFNTGSKLSVFFSLKHAWAEHSNTGTYL
jgi:hypothetical protein